MTKNKCFIFIDLETTGLHFTSEVTEIVAKYQIEGTEGIENLYNSLTNIDGVISNEVIAINKIKNSDLLCHQHYRDAFHILSEKIIKLKQIYDVFIVAHNAMFEKQFMNYNMPQNTMFKLKFICTGANFLHQSNNQMIDKYHKGWSLQKACAYYKIHYDRTKAHRADYDVEKTIAVFTKQIQKYKIEDMLKHFSFMEN